MAKRRSRRVKRKSAWGVKCGAVVRSRHRLKRAAKKARKAGCRVVRVKAKRSKRK
jgi:hypothetical protein